MATLAQFSRRMTRREEAIRVNVDRLKRRVAFAADREFVLNTPVDTGNARSNWQVSYGTPIETTIGPFAPGMGLGVNEGVNASAALSAAIAVLSRPVGDADIFIVNNVDYIGRLNDGSSRQAPAGFVQIGIQNAVSVIGRTQILDLNTGGLRSVV